MKHGNNDASEIEPMTVPFQQHYQTHQLVVHVLQV